MDKESLKVPSSICCNLCFLGFFFSLALTSLSHFRSDIDSFVTMLFFFSSGISIIDGAFAGIIRDLTPFSLFVKTSGN
jgi:hypothetical protein